VHLGIFFTDQQLGLALLPPTELAGFRADGVRYRDTGVGFFTSLYDRLRAPDGQLAGIVVWCLPEAAGLGAALAALGSRPYLRRYGTSPAIYAVLFRELAQSEEEQLDGGGEQAFGGQIFRGDDGGLALTVDLDYLFGSDESFATDLAAVRAALAHWVAITELVEISVAEA
jgi:hypothetical protein